MHVYVEFESIRLLFEVLNNIGAYNCKWLSILYCYRHIRRIIFYSLIQPTSNEKGEKEMDVISVSAALQIAGRAGRYGTVWETVSNNLIYFWISQKRQYRGKCRSIKL